MAGTGTAKELMTLWETRRDDMLGGDIEVEKLENLVKAAKVGSKPMIKILAFKGLSRTGKKVLNLLAEPAEFYVKPGSEKKEPKKEEKPRSTW